MAYTTTELSEYDARPFFLYKFTRGDVVNTFTSANNPIDYGGETYSQSPIMHRGINQTGQIERTPLDIVFPKSDSFAREQFSPDYNQITFLTIYRGFHDFPEDVQVMWKGRVVSYKASGSNIVLTCENIQTTLRRNGLRGTFQRSCRHSLYGTGCGLDINDWYAPFTVSAVTDNVITINTAPADGYYTGGVLKIGETLGFVTKQVGNQVTLLHEIPEIIVGSSIQIAAGCNLSRATCETKFVNQVNFGGFPYIPSRNPFNGFAGQAIA